ncbi:NAD-dependent epimerase/dehydratase family protein [bacterium]|nr:NAD-dependent epimerase/dehydratase family protein [bacterium]
MNILITGATGFIGGHLLEELALNKDNKITCLVRNRQKAKKIEALGVKLIYVDVTQRVLLDSIEFDKIDVIYHCAALVQNKDLDLLRKVNVWGTKNICDLALRYNAKLIYLSSVAVVSGNKETPLKEYLPYKATCLYGQSKLEAEKLVCEYRKRGLKTAIVRPCMVYGENEPHLMRLFLKLIKMRLFPLINKGVNNYHLVYVKTVVDALIYVSAREDALTGTFFIADKEVLTLKEVVSIFAQAIGAKSPWSIPVWFSAILKGLPFIGKKFKFISKDRVYSNQRIQSIGFKFRYCQKESLAKSAKAMMK